MSPSDPPAVTEVAVGVLYDSGGRVLVNQRPDSKTFPGKWEFPGGKVKVGETASQALKRELQEELGVTVDRLRPLISFVHRYDTLTVRLHVTEVLGYRGAATGREGQRIRWVEIDSLRQIDLLDANLTIVRAVELPRICLITDARRFGVRRTLESLERHVARQPVLVIVREKTMAPRNLNSLLRDIEKLCHVGRSLVCIHADCMVDDCGGVDGVHLSSRLAGRQGGSKLGRLVGMSCHSDQELQSAHSQGADYVLLSPVRRTGSHPTVEPLGWQGFADLCQPARVPVYALGGMSYADFDIAIAHGAQGIAMLSAAWRAA